MADELRLSAEVVDRFSGPLRNLRTMLGGVKSPPGARQIKSDFEGIGKAVGLVRREIDAGLQPAMSALGITSLTVGGALAAVGATLRSFSSNTAGLARLAAQSDLTVGALQRWEALGERFGMSTDEMGKNALTFSNNMRDIRRGVGDAFTWLNQQSPAVAQFAQKLKHSLNNDEAIKAFEAFIESVTNSADRAKVAEHLFGSADIGILGSKMLGPLKDQLSDIDRTIDTVPKSAVEAALRFEQSFAKIQQSLGNLRNAIGSDILPDLTALTDEATKWVQANQGQVGKAISGSIHEAAEALKSADWKGIGNDIQAIGSAMRTALDAAKTARDWLNGAGNLGENTKREMKAVDPRNFMSDQDKSNFDAARRFRSGETSVDTKAGEQAVEKGLKDGAPAAGKTIGKEAGKSWWQSVQDFFQQTSFGGGMPGVGGGSGMMPGIINASYQPGGGFGGSFGGGRRGGGDVDPLTSLGSSGSISRGQTDRAMQLMRRLMANGMTPAGAAMAAGNAIQESSVRSNGGSGDHGTAHGMFQWRLERFDALRNFAAKLKKDWRDFDVQADFMAAEAKKRGHGALFSSNDPRAANDAMRAFERYGDNTYGTRFRNGMAMLREWQRRQQAGTLPPKLEDNSREALKSARRQGVVGGAGKTEATGAVNISLDGFPRGVRARTSATGLFKEVTLDRGRAMASEEI